MALNPGQKAFFEAFAQDNAADSASEKQEIQLEFIRHWSQCLLQYAGEPAKVPFDNIQLPTRDGGLLKTRVFNPQLDANRPCLFFPGCGYVADNFEIHSIAVSRIADAANAKVFLVDLRRCPEFALPIPMQDAYDAVQYTIAQHQQFQIDANNVSVAGVSSGAHAAAYVANTSRSDKQVNIKQQILLNGCFDLTNSHRHYDAFEADDALFQRGPVIDFILNLWGMELSDPLVSPVLNDDLVNVPKATLLIAEHDGSRNDSECYYQHLMALGNDVTKVHLLGQTHNTFLLRGAITDGEDPAKVIANLL